MFPLFFLTFASRVLVPSGSKCSPSGSAISGASIPVSMKYFEYFGFVFNSLLNAVICSSFPLYSCNGEIFTSAPFDSKILAIFR